jgi:hypothetical protein
MHWTRTPTTQWKGTTYPVATYYFKQNTIPVPTTTRELFVSRPIPHRRLELTPSNEPCQARAHYASLIRNVPGSHRYTTPGTSTNALDAPEFPTVSCDPSGPGCSVYNAKKTALDRARRIRPGYMAVDPATGSSSLFPTSESYLRNRIKMFDQNNFHYIQSGDASAGPNTNNIYRPNGLASCSNYYMDAQNNTFSYEWTDGNTYQAVFPDGWYTLAAFQNAWEEIQRTNQTYFWNEFTGTIYYAIRFAHDSRIDRISLSLIDPNDYGEGASNRKDDVGNPLSVHFDHSRLGIDGLGFTSTVYSGYSVHDSTTTGKLATTYHRTYYNPSNPQYATSHAVPSSDRILRLQYNTINRTAATYAEPYGHGNAAAMAYGVMRNSRVEKDKHNAWPYTKSKWVNGEWVCVRDCSVRR